MGHQFVRVGRWRIGLREGCGRPKGKQASEESKEPDESSHQASSNGWIAAGLAMIVINSGRAGNC
jgi:hypothetical protein